MYASKVTLRNAQRELIWWLTPSAEHLSWLFCSVTITGHPPVCLQLWQLLMCGARSPSTKPESVLRRAAACRPSALSSTTVLATACVTIRPEDSAPAGLVNPSSEKSSARFSSHFSFLLLNSSLLSHTESSDSPFSLQTAVFCFSGTSPHLEGLAQLAAAPYWGRYKPAVSQPHRKVCWGQSAALSSHSSTKCQQTEYLRKH